MLEPGQQVRAEPAALLAHRLQVIALEEAREESLDEILGVWGIVTAPPQVGEKRMPVVAT
jgi:hypothetical protein